VRAEAEQLRPDRSQAAPAREREERRPERRGRAGDARPARFVDQPVAGGEVARELEVDPGIVEREAEQVAEDPELGRQQGERGSEAEREGGGTQPVGGGSLARNQGSGLGSTASLHRASRLAPRRRSATPTGW
jgi:hypothetical protein